MKRVVCCAPRNQTAPHSLSICRQKSPRRTATAAHAHTHMEIAKRGFGRGLAERKEKLKGSGRQVPTDEADTNPAIVPQAMKKGAVIPFDEFDFGSVQFDDKITESNNDSSIRLLTGDVSLRLGTPFDPVRVAFDAGPWQGIKKGQKRTADSVAKAPADAAGWSVALELTKEQHDKYKAYDQRAKEVYQKVTGKSMEVIEENWAKKLKYNPDSQYNPTLSVGIARTGRVPTFADIMTKKGDDGKEKVGGNPRPGKVEDIKQGTYVEAVFSNWRIFVGNNKTCGLKWDLKVCNRVVNKSVNLQATVDHSEYEKMSAEEEDAEFAKYTNGGAHSNGTDTEGQMTTEECDAQLAANNDIPE